MATPAKLDIRPNVEDARKLFEQTSDAPQKPTLLPICISLPSDLLTPSAIYTSSDEAITPHSLAGITSPNSIEFHQHRMIKLDESLTYSLSSATAEYSFLLESATGASETVGIHLILSIGVDETQLSSEK